MHLVSSFIGSFWNKIEILAYTSLALTPKMSWSSFRVYARSMWCFWCFQGNSICEPSLVFLLDSPLPLWGCPVWGNLVRRSYICQDKTSLLFHQTVRPLRSSSGLLWSHTGISWHALDRLAFIPPVPSLSVVIPAPLRSFCYPRVHRSTSLVAKIHKKYLLTQVFRCKHWQTQALVISWSYRESCMIGMISYENPFRYKGKD